MIIGATEYHVCAFEEITVRNVLGVIQGNNDVLRIPARAWGVLGAMMKLLRFLMTEFGGGKMAKDHEAAGKIAALFVFRNISVV